ncbi:MAG: hypothetical protein H6597_04645 [Flavobacteriales bacterium]|nr:hypothetical protein [Flavobacteriales bacterium]MCB9193802.1 hypothetical protein [Flavobacteriales bacterium]
MVIPAHRSLIGTVLLLGALHGAFAQDLHFQHLTTADGLSDNAITCVFEDRAGYIWVGTEHGLDRYDGNRVDRFRDLDPQLDDDHITGIVQELNGVLWITTLGDGLVRLDPVRRTARRFRHSTTDASSIGGDRLNCVLDLNDTTLSIGAEQPALIFMDKRTFTFTNWSDSSSVSPGAADHPAKPINGWCHAIVPLSNGRLWFGMLNNHYSFIADRSTGQVRDTLFIVRPAAQTHTCAVEMNGMLYCGGWQDGIDRLDLDHPEKRSLIDLPDQVTGLVPWNGGLLVATRDSGLVWINEGDAMRRGCRHERTDPSSLASDRLRCLLRDRGGNLWVGTEDGLDVYAPMVWRTRTIPLATGAGHAADILFFGIEERTSSLIDVFTSEGLFHVDLRTAKVDLEPLVLNRRRYQPTVQCELADGRRLIGTETGILERGRALENTLEGVQFMEPDGDVFAPGDLFQVRGMIADDGAPHDRMIIAALGFGMRSLDLDKGVIEPKAPEGDRWNSTTWNQVRRLVRDADGRYWGATAAGVMRWDPPTGLVRYWGEEEGLLDGDVRDLVISRDKLYVLMSSRLATIVSDHLSTLPAPPGDVASLFGATRDDHGRLWCTSDDGLLRFDPRDRSWMRVPVNDGSRFRKLSRAIITLRDGRLALCANNTLLLLDPSDHDIPPVLPEPVLISAESAGHALAVRDATASLSYRGSVIDITVSALRPAGPGPLEFAYRLDDVESDWRVTSAREAIRYAGVPVGAHRLLVRVRDAFGRQGPEHVLLTITVTAPFWLRWWFHALLAVAVSGGVLWWSRYRLQQALKLQAVRNRIASDLHDEVGSSLSSITIGSQLASQLSGPESEQVRQLLARIGETSSASLRSMSDIVWAIDPKNDEGEALVKRMRRIASELLESKGVTVEMSVSGGVEELKLPMNARKELVLIYKEAVHNASRYSGASLVEVSLARRNGMLTLNVRDNGRGFDPALHPDGHGLGSMKRRGAALGGEVRIDSATGQGTEVSVRVDLTRIRD